MATFPHKEGKHYKHEKLEFWAEGGCIFIEDGRDGTFNVVSCAKFAERAIGLNREAARAKYMDTRDNLNGWVGKMIEALKEAKAQGDPMDPEVAKQQYRQRRKAVLITSGW